MSPSSRSFQQKHGRRGDHQQQQRLHLLRTASLKVAAHVGCPGRSISSFSEYRMLHHVEHAVLQLVAEVGRQSMRCTGVGWPQAGQNFCSGWATAVPQLMHMLASPIPAPCRWSADSRVRAGESNLALDGRPIAGKARTAKVPIKARSHGADSASTTGLTWLPRGGGVRACPSPTRSPMNACSAAPVPDALGIDDHIQSVSGLSDSLLKQLRQSLQKIDEINRITRIISMNARIEAVRTAPGRSFGVIAEEMDTLSRRVSDTAQEIDRMADRTSTDLRERLDRLQTDVRRVPA